MRDALRTAGHVVIVLDDAHLISSPTLSGLIALHEICGVFEPLSIALVGLPALLRHMDREPLLYPLRARTARLTTPGVDIRGYITDRVRRAGGDMDAIFTRDGLAHLALPGAGVPVDIAHRVAAVMDAAADVREKVSAPVVRHIEKEAA